MPPQTLQLLNHSNQTTFLIITERSPNALKRIDASLHVSSPAFLSTFSGVPRLTSDEALWSDAWQRALVPGFKVRRGKSPADRRRAVPAGVCFESETWVRLGAFEVKHE